MKNAFMVFSLIIIISLVGAQRGHCSTQPEEIDPCSLTTADKVIAIFPTLLKAERQAVGPTSVCNYLDKLDIPALIISVSQAGADARDTLTMLDSGYVIEDIAGLGDDAAVAVQQANPQFGLKEGIAALHIKQGDYSLNFSFFRITLQLHDPEFAQVKILAAEMLNAL